MRVADDEAWRKDLKQLISLVITAVAGEQGERDRAWRVHNAKSPDHEDPGSR